MNKELSSADVKDLVIKVEQLFTTKSEGFGLFKHSGVAVTEEDVTSRYTVFAKEPRAVRSSIKWVINIKNYINIEGDMTLKRRIQKGSKTKNKKSWPNEICFD